MEFKYEELYAISSEHGVDILSENFAYLLDSMDDLKDYRSKFSFPKTESGQAAIYMNGNSLGLMPKDAKRAINEQMDKWSNRGGLGHFEEPLPWLFCDEYLLNDMAKIVGANVNEVALMNQLTVNLHLMMISFYRPSNKRFKILCEHKSFPSDYFAFESQIDWHGFTAEAALIEVKPRKNENTLRTEDILDAINERGEEIALICFSGVQYYTGQLFDIARITEAGQRHGCVVGWDLAHTVGNVPLKLHEWNVDFAVWCSYKYLNSGPGGLGGIFVHNRNLMDPSIKFLRGWWGNDSQGRLKMENNFNPAEGALKFRLSNTCFTSCVLFQTSLKIFNEVGMERLRKKSIRLTNYFEFLLKSLIDARLFQIITPQNVSERGAQLSLKLFLNPHEVDRILIELGIFADIREPLVLRMAPCPLYNSFLDVFTVCVALSKVKADMTN